MSWLRFIGLALALASAPLLAAPNETPPVRRQAHLAQGADVAIQLAKKPSASPNPVWIDLTGRSRDLASFQDQFIILNFWASWCAPCQEEMPVLVDLQRRHGIYGVQVVGVSVDDLDKKADAVSAARSRQVNYPILLGGNTDHMQALGLGVALPATAVLNTQGEVVARFTGLVKAWQIEAVLNREMLGVASTDPAQGSAEDLHAASLGEHDEEPGHDCADHPPTAKKRKSSASLVPS